MVFVCDIRDDRYLKNTLTLTTYRLLVFADLRHYGVSADIIHVTGEALYPEGEPGHTVQEESAVGDGAGVARVDREGGVGDVHRGVHSGSRGSARAHSGGGLVGGLIQHVLANKNDETVWTEGKCPFLFLKN